MAIEEDDFVQVLATGELRRVQVVTAKGTVIVCDGRLAPGERAMFVGPLLVSGVPWSAARHKQYAIRGWDRTKMNAPDLECAKEMARKYLASWMEPGDWISFQEMEGTLHACVITEGELTDAACIIREVA